MITPIARKVSSGVPRGLPNFAWFILLPGVILAVWLLVARFSKATPAERPFTPQDVEATKAAARPILAAIEKYRAAKGHPPWTLKTLTNEYLDQIPSPAPPFKAWIYELTEDRKSYALGFSAADKLDHAWWWHGRTQRWTEVKP